MVTPAMELTLNLWQLAWEQQFEVNISGKQPEHSKFYSIYKQYIEGNVIINSVIVLKEAMFLKRVLCSSNGVDNKCVGDSHFHFL